jgi:hypothetical protein
MKIECKYEKDDVVKIVVAEHSKSYPAPPGDGVGG